MRYYILIAVLTIFIVAVLWILATQYTARFQKTLNDEMQTYMVEIAQEMTLVMNERVENNLLNLESNAKMIEMIENQMPEQFVTYMQGEAQR
ncbi:MAG: hypothetical protein RR604_01225, partial [Eubacterium sp.]